MIRTSAACSRVFARQIPAHFGPRAAPPSPRHDLSWQPFPARSVTDRHCCDEQATSPSFVLHSAVPRPGLLYKIFRASHPPIGERVDFINSYRPWERGEPGRYQDLVAH